MSQTTTEVTKVSGLKPWVIAFAVIFPSIAFIVNQIYQGLGTWWVWPALIPLPLIWMLIGLYILSRISKKLNIGAPAMALIFTVMYMTAGSMWAFEGLHYWTSVPLPTWNQGGPLEALYSDPYRSVAWSLEPTILAPHDAAAVNAFYLGSMEIDWGAWMPSITYWIAWSIVCFCGAYFWSYMIRKPLVEVEKLPFTGVAPSAYMLKYYYEEEDGKSRLFNLRGLLTRMFWVGFVFGMILGLPNAISALLPTPLPYYIHQVPINWLGFTSGVMPGSTFSGNLYVPEVFGAQFAPLDMLASAVLYWIVFSVIYNTLIVRAGIVPYTPGWDGSQYQSDYGPFKYAQFSWIGLSLGLSTWVILHYRVHIGNIFRAAFGNKSVPQEEEGIPYRIVVFGALGCSVIWIILYLIGGAAAPMAIIFPFFYIFFMFGWTRMMGEVQEFMPSPQTYSGMMFDVGTGLRLWGGRPDPASWNTMLLWNANGSGQRMSTLAMHHHIKNYKVADMLNVKASGVLIVSIIAMIATAVTAHIFWPYFYTRFGGFNRLGCISYFQWDMGANWQFNYGTPPLMGTAETWFYAITGVAATLVIYVLRARYAWFFLNPIGMLALPWAWWPTWVAAFVIKYATLRIGGSKAFENYLIPFSVGVVAGFGALVIVTAWYELFVAVIPAFISRL